MSFGYGILGFGAHTRLAAAGLSTPVMLDESTGNGSATTLVTGSVSPSANSLIIVFASNGNNQVSISGITSGFTTGGWNDAGYYSFQNSSRDPNIDVWWANYTSGTGTITVTFTGSCSNRMITVVEVTGHDTTTPLTNGVIGNDSDNLDRSPTLTLPGSPAASSIVIGAGNCADAATVSSDSIDEGAAFTELSEHFTTTVDNGFRQEVEYDLTPSGTTVDWAGGWDRFKAYHAFEIQAA